MKVEVFKEGKVVAELTISSDKVESINITGLNLTHNYITDNHQELFMNCHYELFNKLKEVNLPLSDSSAKMIFLTSISKESLSIIESNYSNYHVINLGNQDYILRQSKIKLDNKYKEYTNELLLYFADKGEKYFESFKLLIENGANPFYKKGLPVFFCIHSNNKKALDLLLTIDKEGTKAIMDMAKEFYENV